ncbi:hypothetical protein ASE11_22510 [Hydrogenophaga sp. Root209]|nr:hypothetical protein ASE11_22510 [Hydrogenophaga sp. Root209]
MHVQHSRPQVADASNLLGRFNALNQKGFCLVQRTQDHSACNGFLKPPAFRVRFKARLLPGIRHDSQFMKSLSQQFRFGEDGNAEARLNLLCESGLS